VTRATALPTGQRLTITSDVEALQPLVLTNNGGFYPRVINDAFDKITIIAQQLIEQVGRSLKLPISSTASATLPDPVANRLIAWNGSASGFTNVNPADIATVAAYADAYIDLFTGNGTQTAFTLTYDPAVLANLSVSISGVVQVGGEDFTWVGTTLTFLTAPPSGTRIQVRYTRAIPPADLASAVAAAEADRVATAADRVQTGLDRVATAADVVSAEADRVATAADRVQTGLDVIAAEADRVATAADRVQTGLDAVATAADRAATADKVAASALAAGSGASLVGYQRSATGALTRTLDTLLRENVYDYEFYTPDATPLPDATPQDAAYQNFINAAVGKNAVHTGFVTITGGSSDSTTLGGGAWTVFKSPITIPSNTHIVFQDRDSGVQCATSSLSNGAVFQLHAVSNVSFSGPGRIIGDRVTHTGVGGESLMGIVVAGSSKVTIKDVHISNFWGDGILLGYDRLGNPCSNVVIDNVICDNNRRQGMSVTAGTEVDVTNSGFINTNGTAPQAGVDIEPDPGKNVSHIRFANCYFNGNAGDGFQVAPQNGTFVRGVMVTNCSALSNGRDGFFWGGDGSTPGEGGQFTNCFARLNTEAGFRLSGKYTQLSNCHAFNNGTSGYRFRGEFTSLRLNSGASTGNFTAPVHTLSGITAGETVTGGTSGATATVKYWNSVSKNMVATSISGTFVTGETITGGTSGATMVVRSVLTETASSFNTLTNCTARDNTAHGFYMETTSEHNKLVGCFAIGNSTGFRVITDYNVFEACSSLFNIGSGFSINSGADNNVISGGAASGNESSGVSIAGTGNTVRGMVLRHLGLQGTGISVTSTTGYNLIEGNDCYLSSRFSSDLVLTDTTTISRNNRNIQNHPHFRSGTNTPEGAVTAPIGSLFQRTNGSTGTSLYIKESGTGNTGWVGAGASFATVLTSAADSTALNAAAEGTLLSAGTYNLASDVAGLGKAFFGVGPIKFTGAGKLQSPTRFGVGALANNAGFNTSTPTLTDKNSAFGARALYDNTTGYHNSAFGDEALRSCTLGTQNSAFGVDSQYYLTTAADNSSFGVSSLRDNVTGVSNSAFGRACLFGVLGSNNTGVGRNVAYQATTVDKIVGVGSEAFWSLTTGDENVAVGYRSQYLQTTGANNTTVGTEAGYSGVTNSRTTFVGNRAGFSNTADDTTGFGRNALNANTSGLRNTGLGYNSLTLNSTGADNTAGGWNALAASTTGADNTAFGSQALSAAASLRNTAVGSSALIGVTSGDSNTGVGRNVGSGLTTGSGNTYVGAGIAAGSSSEANAVRIGSGTTTRYLFDGTNHTLVGGYVTVGAVRVSGTQVVGAQGAAVADATDAASVITQLNALLARLRTHGLIAT
jgi:hypothetical protein